VPLEAPWRAPGAEELDRRTFGDWLESNASSTIVRSLLARISAGHHCTRCDEISLLHALFYARSNGGFAAMSGLGSAEKSEYLPDGAQELARRMAASLGGARLRLASPVVGIRHDVEGAVVFGSDFELQASRVIVAIPPTAAHRLRFDPRLTPERELLGARARMGSGYKVHAVFEEPFWRRDGRSGQALFEQGQTSDGSPPDSRRGILVALFEPSYSAALAGHSAPRRRREVLALLAELFGPAALHPLDYIETYWAREVFSGGDVCSLPIGTWSATRNALREPIGCVHWAGTETATEFYSHMEGALQSAERVVHEVQEGLENS
jgi:monoamine oxidase